MCEERVRIYGTLEVHNNFPNLNLSRINIYIYIYIYYTSINPLWNHEGFLFYLFVFFVFLFFFFFGFFFIFLNGRTIKGLFQNNDPIGEMGFLVMPNCQLTFQRAFL